MIEEGKYSVSIHDGSYYVIEVFDNVEITISDVKKIVSIQEKVYNHLKLPVLVLCAEFSTVNNEAMRYLAQNDHFPYSKAGAYVVHSMGQKILANFYLKINSPQRPTKFFNDKTDAMEWLKSFF